jgi:hypothetical protein
MCVVTSAVAAALEKVVSHTCEEIARVDPIKDISSKAELFYMHYTYSTVYFKHAHELPH